jgi:RHS repeat-associated protein
MAVNTHGTGGTIVQQTDYYPFGMDIAVYNGGLDNKYRYNGKEFQDDVINGRSLSWYDYGARFYDPTIGRWTTVDPLCEKGGQESWSPYHYVYNNPVKNTDPDGRIALIDNLIGLAIGAAVEYGGQVAANMIENGPSWSNLTDNIDLGDIALSAGEGFITSGASTLAKVTTAVVSEVARNAIDVKTS